MEPEMSGVNQAAAFPVKRKSGKGLLSVILIVIVVVLGFLYYKKTKEVDLANNPEAQAEFVKDQSESAIADLKEHVVIMEGEEPILLGIVSDATALKQQQAFYSMVENGDQIFIFQKSSRALVWRPSSKQVVNFGLLEVQTTTEKPVEKQPEKPAPAPATKK